MASLTPEQIAFIHAQHVFFVGTAAQDGRVNISPKGLDTLRVIRPQQVLWLNLTGSGNETAAHIRRCNRITLMFCSLEGAARILRLYGTARCVAPNDAEWSTLLASFPDLPGGRQIFDVTVQAVRVSCGEAVPLFEFVGDRNDLTGWAEGLGLNGIRRYWQAKNSKSIDGFSTGIGGEDSSSQEPL